MGCADPIRRGTTPAESHPEAWLASDEVRRRELEYQQGGFREGKWKEYILRRYGNAAEIPWEDPFLQFGLSPLLLGIVNSYLGLLSKLIYVDVWNTIPVAEDRQLTGSQRWHRDPEDIRLVKVFLYFTDVDVYSGPMHYVPHSREGERYGHLWPQNMPYGSLPPSEELAERIPRSEWQVCTYPAGTLLFVDTSGFHMGGRATHSRRVFATWTYVSHASRWARRFKVQGLPEVEALAAPVQFALSG